MSSSNSSPSDGVVLAIDIGSTSIKSGCFTHAGQLVTGTCAQRPQAILADASGRAEIEPESLLLGVISCMAESMAAEAMRDVQVSAVGLSCMMHSLLGVDRAGRPLTRVTTWQDSRPTDAAKCLRVELARDGLKNHAKSGEAEREAEAEVQQRTDCMVRFCFWPAKLRWLQTNSEGFLPKAISPHDRFRNVALWLSPAEWLQQQICGESFAAIGMASSTGLFDQNKLAWDSGMLKHCGLTESCLPRIEASDRFCVIPARHLRQLALKIRSEEGLRGPGDRPLQSKSHRKSPQHPLAALEGARWYAGIGDGVANNLGLGANDPKVAAINFGTSAAVRVMVRGKSLSAPFPLFCYRVDEERAVIGGAISNGGSIFQRCLASPRIFPDAPSSEERLRLVDEALRDRLLREARLAQSGAPILRGCGLARRCSASKSGGQTGRSRLMNSGAPRVPVNNDLPKWWTCSSAPCRKTRNLPSFG